MHAGTGVPNYADPGTNGQTNFNGTSIDGPLAAVKAVLLTKRYKGSSEPKAGHSLDEASLVEVRPA